MYLIPKICSFMQFFVSFLERYCFASVGLARRLEIIRHRVDNSFSPLAERRGFISIGEKTMTNLNQTKVLILATNGFQEDEMFSPLEAMKSQGADVHLASFDTNPISAGESDSRKIAPDMTFDHVQAKDYDAVIIPGGVVNPDKLRTSKKAVSLIREFAEDGKTIAAICHGPWLLAEANILKDREATSYESIKTDIMNAGAHWKDEAVVVSNGIITSRSPDDLDAFNAKIIEEIKEGTHKRKLAA